MKSHVSLWKVAAFPLFLEFPLESLGQVTVQASSFNIIQDCGHETSQRLAGFQNKCVEHLEPGTTYIALTNTPRIPVKCPGEYVILQLR